MTEEEQKTLAAAIYGGLLDDLLSREEPGEPINWWSDFAPLVNERVSSLLGRPAVLYPDDWKGDCPELPPVWDAVSARLDVLTRDH